MLKIHLYPDQILRKQCQFVSKEKFGKPELLENIRQMFEILANKNGIGLAAPQAGLTDHLFIVDLTMDECGESFVAFDLNNNRAKVENKKLVMINSKIEFRSKEMHSSKEGCLSLPNISIWVNRPKIIKIKFFDECGIEHFYEMDSLLSKCAQHELDHLNGKMIIDYSSFILNTQNDKKKIQNTLLKLEKKC